MEPKNKEERRSAFVKFLLLFAVCIVIVITMVFFSIRVPFSQNEKFRAEMDKINKGREFSKKFTSRMIAVSDLIDSISTTPSQLAISKDLRIENELKNLYTMATDTLAWNPIYNQYMVNNLQKLARSLTAIRDKAGKENETNDCGKELERVKKQGDRIYIYYEGFCRQAGTAPLPNPFY